MWYDFPFHILNDRANKLGPLCICYGIWKYEYKGETFFLYNFEILQSFDHGYYLLVKSIQELRSKKDGLVTVGIGGPSGSGKTR